MPRHVRPFDSFDACTILGVGAANFAVRLGVGDTVGFALLPGAVAALLVAALLAAARRLRARKDRRA